MKSLLLFSGGLDSSALLYWKKPTLALIIDYGQLTFKAEQRAATEIAKAINVPLEIKSFGGLSGAGSLFDGKFNKTDKYSEWWPFRNQFLITVASMYAIKNNIPTVLIGLTKSDTIYADSTEPFVSAMNKLTKIQEGAIEVVAPGMHYSTLELIKTSQIPLSILSWSHSCNTSHNPCGRCFSCKKYIQIFNLLKEESKNGFEAIY
jgi:7-cyano-7-deazaguanine synthase